MKNELLFALSEWLAPPLVTLLGKTLRKVEIGRENLEKLKREGAFIYALFHGRMFFPVWRNRGTGAAALVSQSRDGEAVARLVQRLGLRTVRGSSHRGARDAIRGMVSLLREGNVGAIMVDGPRGPRDEPKIGTLLIARLAGVPILPICGAAHPSWEFHSWDRFQLPKPFAKAVLVYGKPFHVPSDIRGDALEAKRLELKEQLLALREIADRVARGEQR